MESLLNTIFDSRAIQLNLDGKTKETALAELIDGIALTHPECDRTELHTAIMERENKLSTGIGNGIALPHAFCNGIDKVAGAIGVSQKGIEYGSLDNTPVNVIFLLAINKQAEESHLRIINLVLKIAQSEALPLIKNAKIVQEIQEILSKISL